LKFLWGDDMVKWKKTEKDCFEYLKEKYQNVSFEYKGNSASTEPDVVVILDNGDRFNIEIKSSSAQCGQFVMLAEDDKFVLSTKNRSLAEISKPFLEYMNEHFDELKLPGTEGKSIDLDTNVLAEWIVKYYAAKGTKFFVTKYKRKIVIFPLDKIEEYFEIRCTYRVKKSGSRNVPQKCARAIKKAFGKDYYYEGKYFILKDMTLKEKEIIKCHDCEFYVSEKRPDGYKITILCETKNATVVFGVKAKKAQDEQDLKLFEEA